jgi:coenzyme Q-binding protein COQ10
MAQVNHVEVFNCSPEEFFNILVDYEKYPEFLKEVKSCKVLETKQDHKIVEYKISVVKDITYVNKHFETRPSEIKWTFEKGDLFKSMKGGWRLEDMSGKTKATYVISAEFGVFVPGMIIKGVLSANLPAMMQAYHKRVKDIYGK